MDIIENEIQDKTKYVVKDEVKEKICKFRNLYKAIHIMWC